MTAGGGFSRAAGALDEIKFSAILRALSLLFRSRSAVDRSFRARTREKKGIAQIRTRDGRVARYFVFSGKDVRTHAGLHANPDAVLTLETASLGARLMMPPINWLEQVNAQKNFQLTLDGPEEFACWFVQLIMAAARVPWPVGEAMMDGSRRFTSMTNGGPCHVWVRDGRIVRITPIDLTAEDGPSWAIEARGKRFVPPRQATISPHTLTWKSLVYSPDRLLHPMKRIDFDPHGERNPGQRGLSGYERISWDEALNIVTSEIIRLKSAHGPSAITFNHPAHHNWGNIGYWLSSLYRFANLVGHTKVNHNPDSWEGWFWGAMHHWGQSMRLGTAEPYSTVEDLLKHAEMVVFWSSDPEATNGLYGGQEGTVRRLWIRELGIPTVHIDPYLNNTAAFLGGKWISPRPGTDTAMALAIAYIWIQEGLYDRDFVRRRTEGFETWKDYILGYTDGVAKSPEWQQEETGVPARTVRALAREWGRKRTYLAAGGWGNGFGGAGRAPTGVQWARSMVCLLALQGFGREGVNFGNLQFGTPIDHTFWFPGYADGGISGDLTNTGAAIALYQRMPHLPTMNSVQQQVPRMQLPEAILTGKAEGFPRDGRSIGGQFAKIRYPAPGASPIRMIYKYGSSNFGTMSGSNRYVEMYRSPNLEFVVNQSIWNEGESRFADIILPACTSFERWDISEWANMAGYGHHGHAQVNHRVITLQHKCIEPLGESRSDYEIFYALSRKLGLGALFSEGMDELGWVQRMFEASDLSKKITWRRFLKRGYYVVPPPSPEHRPPVAFRWFYEGRPKDTPEPSPLASEYAGQFRNGFQTQSGKFEFECQSLATYDPHDEERSPILKYQRSWEGYHSERHERYPFQLITPHPRFSFHSHNDGKSGFLNEVRDHRRKVGNSYYLVLRINISDAIERGIQENDLVRVYNDRGSVICVAVPTARLGRGMVHGYESSARYEPIVSQAGIMDRGGSLNTLTSKRPMIANSHSIAASACLVDIERCDLAEIEAAFAESTVCR
ncbi:molybdopterin-dependent oxidoreductase [Bradyrhizobium sp. STM 3561]|uniref:molybdopterin-dependent oxidoreductase n=1 Tax=Bradyrhizobium sp. STM 3561 TaxID=578923 RepID=UPI00388D6CE5